MYDAREEQLIQAVDAMAERYGMLPTEIFERATTHDLMIFFNANMIKYRNEKKSRGESIADTYNQSQIDEMYSNFKNKHGNENK